MGERELREKYGGKLPKAINRAIRAEIPGGNEALDTLTHLAASAKQSHWHDKQGRPTPEADAYFKHQRNVIERMEAQVRRTWDVAPGAGTGTRTGGGGGGGGKAAPRRRAGTGAPKRSRPPKGNRRK